MTYINRGSLRTLEETVDGRNVTQFQEWELINVPS